MTGKKIAVLIPCYNEELTVEKVVKDFRRVLPEAEIYVYDNNSTDNSAALAEQAGAILRHEYKQGKGNVMRSMFRDIDADCYLMVDADDAFPAEKAGEMVDLVLSGQADMVDGYRVSTAAYDAGKRPFHDFGNKLVRFLVNTLFNGDLKDIMTGYRALSRNFVKQFPLLSERFEIETEMTVFALDGNFLIKEIPVECRDRPAGSVSKLNTFRDGFKVLALILKLFRECRPMWFFGIPALLCFVLGTILFIPVFHEFLKTGLVLRFPTLFVSVFLYIASLLFFCSGLILSVLTGNLRKTRELMVKQLKSMEK